MNHCFNIKIAEECGILESIVFEHIYFWTEKNQEKELNYHDGCYWMQESIRRMAELYPYATERQIKLAINNLKEKGLIMTGNYSRNAWDRTLYYAISEHGYALRQEEQQAENSIVQECQMDQTKMSNRLDENVPSNKSIDKSIESGVENSSLESKEQMFVKEEKEEQQTVVLKLPLLSGSSYLIKDKDIKSWEKLYPAVDVLQELHNMLGWFSARPDKIKPLKDINWFVCGWLQRRQNDLAYIGRSISAPKFSSQTVKNKFFNFEQREYTQDQLDDYERILLKKSAACCAVS